MELERGNRFEKEMIAIEGGQIVRERERQRGKERKNKILAKNKVQFSIYVHYKSNLF